MQPGLIIRGFILAADDAQEDCVMAVEAVARWNAVNSRFRAAVVEPVMLQTHGELTAGRQPKPELFETLLLESDFLIGIFRRSIEPHQGEALTHAVRQFVERAGAEAVRLFFVDGEPSAEASPEFEQFRAEMQSRGLVSHVADAAALAEKLRDGLDVLLNGLLHGGQPAPSVETPSADESPRRGDDSLSADATELLREAVLDRDGMIEFVRHAGGLEIKTNGREFVPPGEVRAAVRWQEALEELVAAHLVVDRDEKGFFYEVTAKGFRLGDTLDGS